MTTQQRLDASMELLERSNEEFNHGGNTMIAAELLWGAYPESTEGMGRCWSGWGSEGMGMAGTALIPTDRGWFVV